MILSNKEIQKALDTGRLVIEPEPSPRELQVGKECPYNTHSVDLTLADDIVVPKKGPFTYDLKQGGDLAALISSNSKKLKITDERPYHLEPQKFILARTIERIELPLKGPPYLAARIEGKSSRARCGILVHFTAPTVHPGFEGTLTLEMINLGPTTFTLRPRMTIAQLIIEQVEGDILQNPSQFQGQSTPAGHARKRAPKKKRDYTKKRKS